MESITSGIDSGPRMMPARGSKKLQGLEASRGVAALLVVLFHASAIMSLPKYFGAKPLEGFFGFGYAGVDFFFVLSGFIILFVHYRDIGNRSNILPYLTKRFIRIYPLHWVVLVIFLAGLIVYPLGSIPNLDKIIRSFLLLPQHGYPVGVVAWTLIFEVFFYLIFGVLIFNRSAGSVLLVAWFAAVVAGSLLTGKEAGYLQRFLFSLHNLEFLLGMSVALAIRKWKSRGAWKTLGGVGVVVFAVAGILDSYLQPVAPKLLLLLYAGSSALVIYALVAGDLSGGLRQPANWLVFLGSASYSIYLMHFLVLSVSSKVLLKLGANHSLPLAVSFVVLVVCAVGVGALLHLIVEKPLLRRCRAALLPSQ
jgi:exopolysaccharide production protein ExoZ